MTGTGRGKVEWIGLRTDRAEPMRSVADAAVDAQSGLAGDRFQASGPKRRQVTFVQQEHLPVVAALLGKETIGPEATRRNVLVSGINLLSLENQKFKVGECVFLCTGPCEPCQRMNTTLGPGGLDSMVGHGGIMATVVEPGTIHVGDEVTRLKDDG